MLNKIKIINKVLVLETAGIIIIYSKDIEPSLL